MKRITKGEKIISMYLAILFVFSTIVLGINTPEKVLAASKTLVYEQSKSAKILASNKYNFKINGTSDVEINVYVPDPTGVTLTVRNQAGKIYGNPMILTNYDASWVLDGRGWYTYKYVINQLKAGSYSVDYIFDKGTIYDAKIVQVASNVSFNRNKLTLTKGFSERLKINNAKALSWSSSNSSVAVVDSNGKIKGKKAGKAIITATCNNGEKLKCTVTVKNNIFSSSKITKANAGINEYKIQAYYAKYQKNGNLTVKIRIVNETSKKITSIPKLNIDVTSNNKSVAAYSKNSFKVNVPAHGQKDYSITIKKRQVTNQKADLRKAVFEINGERVRI